MFRVEIEDVKPSAKKIHIEVPGEYVKKKKDALVSQLKKTISLKGFRKGKVPKALIEQTYKEDIEENLKRDLTKEAYEFVVQDKKLKPVADAAFTSIELKEDLALSFDVTVDVRPEFELKDYKNIEIEKRPVTVTEEEINKALEQLREAFATLEDKDTGAEENDVAVINLKTFTKDTHYPIKEFSAENMYVELGKKQLIEEIEQGIYGMKPGEKKSIEASFDDNYPLRALKGKDVVFEVELVSLKRKKIPELNDEFAKKINKNFNTVSDLTEDVKKKLKENKEKEEIAREKEVLLEKLLEQYDFELPQTLVNQETNQMIMEYVKNMYYMGADVSSDEFKPAVLREKFEPEARRRVKATFILLKIAENEKIDVSSEEIKEAIAKEANSLRKSFEELYKEYQEKGLLPLVEMDILGEKALDAVYKQAKIVEKSPEAENSSNDDGGDKEKTAEGEKKEENNPEKGE